MSRSKRNMSDETRNKIRKSKQGIPLSEEHKLKISRNSARLSGKNHPMFGKTPWNKGEKVTDGTVIQKMRLSAIKRISKQKFNGGQVYPRYNINACKIIDGYGKQNGYNFQHAENGGEFFIKKLGYWVDGYDKEKNVVIEYDESYHGKQQKKDIRRMNEIIQHLKCKFMRMKENGEIYLIKGTDHCDGKEGVQNEYR